MLSRMLNRQIIDKLEVYWREGKYADLWSVNHTLSGVILGGILFEIGVSFTLAFSISLVLFIAWEVFEITSDIKEHILNLLSDVVFDLLGFFFSTWIYLSLNKSYSGLVWTLITLITTGLTFWGFLAYQRRTRENQA